RPKDLPWVAQGHRRRDARAWYFGRPDQTTRTRRPMNRRALRPLTVAACVTACLLALASLAACKKKQPLGKPWVRLDLTRERPFVEAAPPGVAEDQVYQQRLATLGAGEVRDMSRVPAAQQQQFPKSSAGEIRVIEQTTYSRLKWRVHVDDGAYVSFVPLGYEK